MKRTEMRSIAFTLALSLLTGASAQIASDSAQNYAAWTPGSNGGFGFQPWLLSPWPSGSNAGFFLASSTGNGAAPSGGIDSPNRTAFGLYSNSGIAAAAQRPFLVPMTPGQTFSVLFDNGWIDPGQRDEIVLRVNGLTVMVFGFTGGSNTYDVIDAGPVPTFSPLPFTDGGLRVQITPTSLMNYTLVATDLLSNASWVHNGTFANGGGLINEFVAVNSNAGSGPPRDFYVNDLKIVPEPGSILAMGAGLAALGARRRRKA